VRFVLKHLAFGTDERPSERDIDEYWAPTRFHHFTRACRACLHGIDWHGASQETRAAPGLPVLVIAGGRDRVVLGAARRGRDMPGAKVIEIRDAGHLVIQERASLCNAAILEFVTSVG